ncbi:unnamed protein product [Meganyctiphanes norvegica]|uniref:CUB domain-containing protein n=1 Tax=Meganyctiphanes norvegica TaxID=48144 RepID=A0AAV2R5V2_MEGNR
MASNLGLILHLAVACLSLACCSVLAYEMGDCGGTFTDLNGFFYSPDYPESYPKSTKCNYKFKTGYPITFDCTAFILQTANNKDICKKDWLRVDDNGEYTKYCGSTGPSGHTTEDTTPILKFKSNAKTQKAGFSCTYTSVVDTTTTTSTTTTTAAATTTEITAELLISAVSLQSSGTCYKTSRSTCGCSVTYEDSEVYSTIVGDYRIVASNGVPNHVYETGQVHANPNDACPHEVYMAVPANPTKGDTFNSYGMGIVGISISGGFLYNHLSSPAGDLAVYNEWESFDTCNGHSDQFCRYHYHEVPVCIAGEGNCTMVGYMRDGFAVHTFCAHETDDRYLKSCYQLNDGEEGSMQNHFTYNATAYSNGDCDLDLANGYTFSDGYAYVFTEDYPYIMMGYYGEELADICYLTES